MIKDNAIYSTQIIIIWKHMDYIVTSLTKSSVSARITIGLKLFKQK